MPVVDVDSLSIGFCGSWLEIRFLTYYVNRLALEWEIMPTVDLYGEWLLRADCMSLLATT